MLRGTCRRVLTRPQKFFKDLERYCIAKTYRPGDTDWLFYLIFIKIFNHIVGMCRELVLRNALSDWLKPGP